MAADINKVVTRFAPSPTGFLHIGGARTALFNWLFAAHHGGVFRLRIEDTDRKRSTDEATKAIFDGMNWLGLTSDEEVVFQYANRDRHAEIAQQLLDSGKAYHCYCSKEELSEMRDIARKEGHPVSYNGKWRDMKPSDAPKGIDPVVRFKAPKEGEITIHDLVQGDVTTRNDHLDDMILLRADGSPTYMLSVVVDDHDMGVTHIIRGDDHLVNAARQAQLINAIGWNLPIYAHIPLIHGADGAKLSKRHGALGVDVYRGMGYFPEAVKNYLLRLGWSHGDDEIISQEQAIEWFGTEGLGKSPSRFDFAKLENLNGHYIREIIPNDKLLVSLLPELEKIIGKTLNSSEKELLLSSLSEFKSRAKIIPELAQASAFLFADRPLTIIPKAEKLLNDDAKIILGKLHKIFSDISEWSKENLEEAVKKYSEETDLKLGKLLQPVRAALTGSNVSPSVFEIFIWLGKEETLNRMKDYSTFE
jgi:glutamyl-tRNA synthetase